MVDDVGFLYRSLSGRLQRIVGRQVHAPTAVIEDACQVAWSLLVINARRVDEEAVLPWLARTAVHEALRLDRRERREPSLEAQCESGMLNLASPDPGPDQLAEWHEQLAQVRRLPTRQQRVLWMRAVGHSSSEIAAESGMTLRIVERQMMCGRRRLRAAA